MKKKTTTQTPQPGEKMELDTMKDLLVELSYSKFWQAYQLITTGWIKTVESGLRSIDPFKEPTQVARGQGQLLALNFLNDFVEGEKKIRAKAEQGKVVKK